MKYAFLLLFFTLMACSKEETTSATPQTLTQYVDPFIGTGDHGHVFMGANVPFGLVQAGPTQFNQGWDWCSGYHYSDSTIIGFGQMHLSGTGIGDLGDVALMPFTTTPEGSAPALTREGLCATFSHDQETAKPGYYAVTLNKSNIQVEITATERVAFYRITYPDQQGLVVDLLHGIGWDALQEAYMEQEGPNVISGYRKSKGWAEAQTIYFTASFSQDIASFEPSQDNAYGVLRFANPTKELQVKVALSPTGIAQAKRNMALELPQWDFDHTATLADKAWETQLAKIKIETPQESYKRIFYTALYHTMIAPSVFCDAPEPGAAQPATTYTTFSLWDTYRAAHPLATIIHPEKMMDYAQTFLAIFDKQGYLPVWHLVGNETNCMVGNPGIPVLADILLKGFPVDKERVYKALKQSALKDSRGLKWMRNYGFVPYDKDTTYETVAKSLEYALADWCVAQVADSMGNRKDVKTFTQRSKAYEQLFDTQTGFLRAKSSDGVFREPFNPFHSSHRVDDYTEGNAWQYTWLVPHDVPGLIACFGGPENFLSKFDSLFVVSGDMGADASPDISGLIGQYAHGNEPSHHIPYMYAYAGQPWKTAQLVRQILTTLYHDAPAGLCGNEDVGQMSAWYVLSALGFYQVEPAGGKYVLGSPLMDKAVINVGDGKTFTIIAKNNAPENKFIQSVTLNGMPYTDWFIRFADIQAGGTLVVEMTSTHP